MIKPSVFGKLLYSNLDVLEKERKIKMLKAVENLIHDANKGRKSAKYGNHHMEQTDKTIKYYYYWTCICEVDKTTNNVKYDASYGTSSTTRAVNSYRQYYN